MNIYVVANERIIRISLADELRDAGYQVFEFASVNSALSQMKNVIPDLVITSLRMPDMGGIEFLKEIKKINKNIFVVLMTAYSNISTVAEAMKMGVYDYVEKPFAIEKMLTIIDHILELKLVKDENKKLKNKLKKI